MENETALRADYPPREQSRRIDAEIARLASRQHGVVSLSQLIAVGLNRRTVTDRVASGRLHRIHKGVFAVGHKALTREGRWMAAVLWGGDGAALSHQAAGAHHGLRAWNGRRTITLPRHRRSNAQIAVHHSDLPVDEIKVVDGIPTTTVARTIFDLAATLDRHGIEQVIREAEVRQLGDEVSLPMLLERHRGGRGTAALKAVLADLDVGGGVPFSELEDRFLRFLEDEEMPIPEVNAPISLGDRIIVADCVWRESRTIVELDGYAVHSRRAQRDADTLRDRELLLAGWRVIRVTWRHLHAGRRELAADLKALLAG